MLTVVFHLLDMGWSSDKTNVERCMYNIKYFIQHKYNLQNLITLMFLLDFKHAKKKPNDYIHTSKTALVEMTQDLEKHKPRHLQIVHGTIFV